VTAISEELQRAIQRLRMRTVHDLRQTRDEAKRLDKTLAEIAKQFGADVLAPIKLMAERHDVQCVSTGYQALDDVISGRTERKGDRRTWVEGSGRGLPRSRIIEIYGPESSGKTTLALELIKSYQERGLEAAFIDAEHSLDMDYAEHIGCDVDNWLYSQGGESAEDTLGMTIKLVEASAVDILVVDSVAALTPQAEVDGDMGDYHVGLQARLMSQACRKLNAVLKRDHRCTVVFLNQTRSKIGVRYGNPETTTGGNALKFYATVRMRTSNMGEIKSGGEKGMRGKIRIVKTKIAVPFGECFADITGGNGITRMYSSDPRGKEKAAKEDSDGDD